MHDFHPIAFLQAMRLVPATRDDLAVDFDRDAAIGQTFAGQQSKDRGDAIEDAFFAIQLDFHAAIVPWVEPCGSAGWRVSVAISKTFTPYARLTYEREFKEPAEEAFARAQSLPGSAAYAVPGFDFDEDYGTLTIGTRTRLLGLDANLGYQVTFGQEAGSHAAVFATVGKGF